MKHLLRATILALLIACRPGADEPPRQSADSQASPPGTPAPSHPPGGATPSAPPADPTPGPSEQPAPSERSWTVQDTRVTRPVAGVSTLRTVRTARHEGFDRMVFDFGTDPVPSYRLEYVDRPVRACGSGDVVPLPGQAWLAVHFEPARAHTDEGEATVTNRDQRPGLRMLLRLRSICDYEAHVDWVAALPSPEPYATMLLTEPNRLVVDVRHSR